MTDQDLIAIAWDARENAYAPYSNFKVGAALLSADGQTFPGCNVENISYGLTNCAERVAIANAISSGYSSFATIAIVADTDTPISPCGACRQVMAEFNINRILTSNESETLTFTLDELLPRATTGILNRS
jgi:cytidine deaminase